MYKSNINLNLYKIFYEVAKSGSISAASKSLYSSQPAISKSIKNLEEELGVKLFYRNLNGTKLTAKGEELLFYVEEACNNFLTAERCMIEAENLEKGKLSIGVPSQIATFYIFDKVEKFHKMYPNVEITIVSKSTSDLLKLLERHEIDFIIDSSPINVSINNCVIKKLIEVENSFVANSKLCLKNKIKSIKDLADEALVLPVPGTANRNSLDNLFKNKDITLKNVINIHTSEMIIGAVKKELGIGYVIYDLVKDDILNGEIDLIKVKEKLPKIEINLVFVERYLTEAPMKFITSFLEVEIEK